jgi:hypothetical protein
MLSPRCQAPPYDAQAGQAENSAADVAAGVRRAVGVRAKQDEKTPDLHPRICRFQTSTCLGKRRSPSSPHSMSVRSVFNSLPDSYVYKEVFRRHDVVSGGLW